MKVSGQLVTGMPFAVAAATSRLRLGHGLEPGTDLGPMAADRFRDKVDAHVADAVAHGARVVAGGSRPDRRGWFYEPTVLDRLARRWDYAGPRWHLRIALAILLATFLAVAVLDDPAFYDSEPTEQLP